MEPFTPKRRSRIRRDKLTLSAKQYSKARLLLSDGIELAELVKSKIQFLELSEPSFIAEKSFVDAPLNSRVPVQLVTTKTKGKQKAEPLDRVPLEVQEALILEDLLFVLMGIEGTYITYPSDVSLEDEDPNHGLRFVVAPSLDPSLRDLVERVLPLATYYTAITTFIQDRSHLEYGLVNHALCAATRDMLKDYHTLLSQLEHAFQHSPSFSLQKLWFYVHPTLHTLSLIHGLISEIVDAEEPPESGSDSDESEEDPEEQARNEALGLGGAKFKALVSEMKKSTGGSGVPAGPAKGGEVLSILHERMQRMSGDPSALALHRALMRAAGRPYAEMLVAWTRSGKLDDPYEEFCVKESKFIDKANLNVDYTDEYWERRYTLRDGSTPSGTAKTLQAGIPSPRTPGGRLPCGACIPPLLESWKHKVLLSGKYLNVLQECGKEIRRPNALEDEDFAMENDKLYKAIEDAYAFADSTLVKILVHDQQLIPRLRSLKHYFLLSQSAFLTHFLDAAHSELKKSARGANIDKLQSLFDVALNTDGCTFVSEGEPTFKEDVKVSLGDSGLYDKLQKILSERGAIGGPENDMINDMGNDEEKKAKGKDEKDTVKFLASSAFQLDYKVNFPLSLVISRTSIVRYQFLFRFLFHVRRIEQALLGIWTEHTMVPWRECTTFSGAEEKYRDISHWCRCLFLQRARMLGFVQQLLAFVTSEVIEPNWRRLEASLARVGTVEALFRVHLDFVDTCLKECMLTNGRLIQAIEKILTTCDTFAQYGSAFTKSLKAALETDDTETIQRERTKRWEFLKKFTKNFEHWFGRHVDRVQYDASSGNGALLPLYSRLSSIQSTSSLDQL